MLLLSAARTSTGIEPFFLKSVLREHGFDLLVAHGEPSRPKARRDGERILLGRMDDGHEDIDDVQRVELRRGRRRQGNRRRHELASAGQLRAGHLAVGVKVDVHPGDALARDRPFLDQAAECVVHAQPQDRLQLLVRVPGRRLLDQDHDGRPKRAVPRETDIAREPQACIVERGDVAEGVIASCVAVAGQVSHPVQHA